LIAAGNLGWKDVPFRARLSELFGVPAFVEHDANAAAIGERWRGHARAMASFVFLALGTGIGAGLFLDGRLYRGAHNAAGELGDLIPGRGALGETPDDARPLSDLIGSGAIREKAREASGEELDAASSLRAADGDEALKPLADEVIDYIALTVISVATLVDPEAIIFGGGTSSAGDELLERVGERVRGKVHAVPRLLRSALSEDAQLYGAIYGALVKLSPELPPPSR
jgi:predicted NBD/HSP70 family sugar kinase